MQATEARNGAGYPAIVFWNAAAAPLEVINPGDLLLEPFLKRLGLNQNPLSKSIAVSDRDEILRRHRVMKYLLDNRRMNSFLRRIKSSDLTFPDSEQAFLDHFKKGKNRFWSVARKFIRLVEQSKDAPAEFVVLADYLRDAAIWLQREERGLADDVAREIQRVASIKGRVTFELHCPGEGSPYVRALQSMAYGHQLYSYSLSNKLREFDIDPSDGKFKAVKCAVLTVLEWFKRGTMYSPLMIRRMPRQLESDLSMFFNRVASEAVDDVYRHITEKRERDGFFESDDIDSLRYVEKLEIAFDFEYEEGELRLRIVGMEGKPSKWISAGYSEWNAENYPGYGPLDRWRMENHVSKVNKEQLSGKIARIVKKYVDLIEERHQGFRDGWITVESPQTDSVYRWTSLKAVLGLSGNVERYKRSCECRNGFGEHVRMLQEIGRLADSIETYANLNRLPLTFPTVLADGHHLVSFDGLYPIHLIGREIRKDGAVTGSIRAADLVPLQAFPPINGQMVGLTGKNAGGKTAALEALSQALYMAHAGLPVFARSFEFNVKDAIGLLFLERGDGSVAELMVEKIKSILRQVEILGKEKIILFFDELGSATAEGGVRGDGVAFGGYRLGEEVLRKVKRHGCSVIFSTQITALAEEAEKSLGTANFRLTAEHRIEPGIGSSDIEDLMKTKGLEEYLKR